MRVVVAGAFRAGTQLAHAINTVKMAQGFARLGHEVIILCRQPSRGSISPQELARVYGMTEPLLWIQLPSWVGQHWLFAFAGLRTLLRLKPDLVFARSYIVPWLNSRLGVATVAESHAHIDNRSAPFMRLVAAAHHPAFRLWVTISEHLADHYHALGVPRDKLIVLPDAVDLRLFQRPAELPPSPYPGEQPVAAYIGHLYDYKGIPTVLEAAALLPPVRFHLVGGSPEDVNRQRARVQQMGLTNVVLHGLKAHSEVPPFLWHADVLLLPPSAHHPSAAWTSPLKVGEYLASGTPVVATSIPALRHWLSDDEVKFVPPDDGAAMAEGIATVLRDHDNARRLIQAGLKKAQTLSYQHRAARVLVRLAT
jgi:glycosyltransferase involved in cell wall biosynthesis